MRKFPIVGAGLEVSWATFAIAIILSACALAPSTPPSTVLELANDVSQNGIFLTTLGLLSSLGARGLSEAARPAYQE